jgi:hypothetical protein
MEKSDLLSQVRFRQIPKIRGGTLQGAECGLESKYLAITFSQTLGTKVRFFKYWLLIITGMASIPE